MRASLFLAFLILFVSLLTPAPAEEQPGFSTKLTWGALPSTDTFATRASETYSKNTITDAASIPARWNVNDTVTLQNLERYREYPANTLLRLKILWNTRLKLFTGNNIK